MTKDSEPWYSRGGLSFIIASGLFGAGGVVKLFEGLVITPRNLDSTIIGMALIAGSLLAYAMETRTRQ